MGDCLQMKSACVAPRQKDEPAYKQVGAVSWRIGLSVKQTLPIAPNNRSRLYIVDYVYPKLRTPQIFIYYSVFFILCQRNNAYKFYQKAKKVKVFEIDEKFFAKVLQISCFFPENSLK